MEHIVIKKNLEESVKIINLLFDSNKKENIEKIELNFDLDKKSGTIYGTISVETNYDGFESEELAKAIMDVDKYVYSIFDRFRFDVNGKIIKNKTEPFMFGLIYCNWDENDYGLKLKYYYET
jgi:hypothetical protein